MNRPTLESYADEIVETPSFFRAFLLEVVGLLVVVALYPQEIPLQTVNKAPAPLCVAFCAEVK